MRKTILSLSTLLILCVGAQAQNLTLEQCKQKAHDNYPAIKQYGLIEKSRELNVSNASKSWLPGVSVTGFGAAFTDIVDLKPQMQAMTGEMKNYAFGVSATVSQVIYDGGAISAKKNMEQARADMNAKQIDVNIYDINQRIEQLYFGTLMMDEQIQQVELLQQDLSLSEKTVKSLIDGGLANQSDLDAVNVRQVQAEQQEMGLKAQRKTYLSMLGYFISEDLPESTTLVKPSTTLAGSTDGTNRPELAYYASQEKYLDTQRKALDTRLLPTVSAIGMATYHSTVMPLAKDYVLGAGVMVKWNVGALYTRKNDIANIDNQRMQIATQRETFLFNNRMQNRQSNGTIDNIRQQMSLDDKAISLRESIKEKAEKKVKNGTETVNELLRDVNAVSEARQQKAIHEIQLLQETYKLKTINNE